MSTELAMAIRRARWCDAPVLEPVVAEEPEPATEAGPVPCDGGTIWLPRWPWSETPAWKRSTCNQVRAVIQAAALHYEIPPSDIISCRRLERIVLARHVVMYLAKTLTTRSLPDIAHWIGNKDHTTVLHAVKKIAKKMQTDTRLVEDIAAVRLLAIGLNPTLA